MDNHDLIDYYNHYDEDSRLTESRHGQVEYLTTRKYVDAFAKKTDKLLEIGAGTGRYSVTLAKEGYDVTAVELVESNLNILRSKLDGSEKIETFQGNALDLSFLESGSFDVTMLLGPMYHLYTHAEQVTALKEALRVTKPGGYILVAYCMNEATVIQYVFGCNSRNSLMDLHGITPDWKCVSQPKDLFQMMRLEDIDAVNAEVDAQRVKIVATDGASRYIRDYLERFDGASFARWLDYHFATGERIDLIGATNHSLDILRKKDT